MQFNFLNRVANIQMANADREHVQVMIVVGGQAPKAIRSVECYDFQEDRWYQVADLPSRRCRAGQPVFWLRIYKSHRFSLIVCFSELYTRYVYHVAIC